MRYVFIVHLRANPDLECKWNFLITYWDAILGLGETLSNKISWLSIWKQFYCMRKLVLKWNCYHTTIWYEYSLLALCHAGEYVRVFTVREYTRVFVRVCACDCIHICVCACVWCNTVNKCRTWSSCAGLLGLLGSPKCKDLKITFPCLHTYYYILYCVYYSNQVFLWKLTLNSEFNDAIYSF